MERERGGGGVKPMSREEFIALGNPPEQWDDLLETARENSEHIRRKAMKPHPWDEWVERDRARKRLITGPPRGTA